MPLGRLVSVVVCVDDATPEERASMVGQWQVGCPPGLLSANRTYYMIDASSAEVAESSLNATSAFAITPEDGGLIGASILGVWAVSWVFRQIRKAMETVDKESE